MPELSPYTFDEETLAPQVQPHLIRTENFRFRGDDYTFGVIDPSAAPFPNFVGMPEGHNLFASQDVVDDRHLMEVSLGHEVLCNRIFAELPGVRRCPQSEKEILGRIPASNRLDVLQERFRMFSGLVQLMQISLEAPEEGFHEQIVEAHNFVQSEIRRLSD